MFTKRSISLSSKPKRTRSTHSKDTVHKNGIIPLPSNQLICGQTNSLQLLDSSAFHSIQHSLLWKYHLFNVNASMTSIDLSDLYSSMNTLHSTNLVLKSKKKKSSIIPSDAVQITFSKLETVSFSIFRIPTHFNVDDVIRTDGDQRILQNVIKLSLFYHNLIDHDLATLIRAYLVMEYRDDVVLRKDIIGSRYLVCCMHFHLPWSWISAGIFFFWLANYW